LCTGDEGYNISRPVVVTLSIGFRFFFLQLTLSIARRKRKGDNKQPKGAEQNTSFKNIEGCRRKVKRTSGRL
jgi:hypothetical protein